MEPNKKKYVYFKTCENASSTPNLYCRYHYLLISVKKIISRIYNWTPPLNLN
jgi:hypothetical protein